MPCCTSCNRIQLPIGKIHPKPIETSSHATHVIFDLSNISLPIGRGNSNTGLFYTIIQVGYQKFKVMVVSSEVNFVICL